MNNLTLTAALLRNRRNQGLRQFLTTFDAAVGMQLEESQLIDPDASVEVLAAIERIGPLVRQGRIHRVPELTWAEAEERVKRFIDLVGDNQCIVVLFHFGDYIFRTTLDTFYTHATRLLDLSGDNVLAVSDGGAWGIGIDRYTSEISGERRFTMDSWLDWTITRPSCGQKTQPT